MDPSKALVLMEALSIGMMVRIGKSSYQLFGSTIYKATQETKWLLTKEPCDMAFSEFLELADSMTDDEFLFAKGSLILRKAFSP